MLIYSIKISGTASSGVYSFNTSKFDNAILKQIIVKAASNDTTFDFQLINDLDLNQIDTTITGESGTGVLNKQVDIPLKGIYTVKILNSSDDEAFTGELLILEEN